MKNLEINGINNQSIIDTKRVEKIKELVSKYYYELNLETKTLEETTKIILNKFSQTELEIVDLEQKIKLFLQEQKNEENYQKKITRYEKLGAEKFKKAALKLEKIKFNFLHTLFPNYINNFDRVMDIKIDKEINKIKKQTTRRSDIEKNIPVLLKPYDKVESLIKKLNNKKENFKDSIRVKIKVNFPKLLDFYDEYIKEEDFLKDLSPEEKIEKLTRMSKFSKMYARTEHNTRKNKNYHVELSAPNEFEEYLKLNKKIHVRGLLRDAILIPILTVLTIAEVPITLPLIALESFSTAKNIKDVNVLGLIENIFALPVCIISGLFGFSLTLPLLILEIISAGINFECVNLQNHNIARFKKVKAGLQKRYERKRNKKLQYSDANKIIYQAIKDKKQLPNFNDILAHLETPEQIRQMRELLKLGLMAKGHPEKQIKKKATKEENLPSFEKIIDQAQTTEELKRIKEVLKVEEMSKESVRGNIK